MKVETRPDCSARVLVPEASDDPANLEDAIHDEGARYREKTGEKLPQVVLDLSGVSEQGPWLRAAGPQQPDTNLRVALGEKGYLTARALRLDAVYEWYPDVEAALNGGR